MLRELKQHWAPAAFGLLCAAAVAVVAVIDWSAEQRAGVVIGLGLPAACCLAMMTPTRELTSRRKWIGAVGATAATALLAISPVVMKFVRAPIFESASVREGDLIPVSPGSRVRVELQVQLPDKKDAIARVTIAAGGPSEEVVFRPRYVHVKRKRQPALHSMLRDPAVEERRLTIPEAGEGIRVEKTDGELEGSVGVRVFAEELAPGALLALSGALLLGVGALQRSIGLPRNSTVGAGAALGFGVLVYSEATPQMVAQKTLGAIVGGIFFGALLGALVGWVMVPELRRWPLRQRATRFKS